MSSAQPSDPRRKLVRADPNTIRGKFLVGYRGWYTCPGDGPKLVEGDDWAHWTNEYGQFNPELVPDPAYYAQEALSTVPQTQSKVFSSRNASVVRRHMNIMAQHKIDGLFLTRRGDEIAAAYQGGKGVGIMKMRSETINHIFRAAEHEGRVVSVMYDLSGMPSYQIEQWVAGDWEFLVNQKHVLDSPAYVREHGKPVIALWGVGFKNASQDPQTILNLIRRLSEASGGAFIILGVPITWQKQDSNWQTVYQVADAIAPLSIGTLVDEETVNNWSKDVQHPAIQSLRAGSKKQDYVSVIWPGHEGHLLRMGISGPAAPRRDGAFLWRQVYNAHRDGARMIYAEMLDGFDDGTAILPSIGATQSGTPSDWYLRICGYASEALKGEKHLYEDLPRKELAEYWSTRPHYEEEYQEGEPIGGSSGGGASAGVGGTGGGSGAGPSLAPPARAPTRSMTADFGDAPPPYTLEPGAPTGPSSNAVYTAEPESVNPTPAPVPGPGPSSSRPPYQADRPTAPSMNRTDSVHSVASSSHSQQHRPGQISVPDPNMNAIPVQTPSTYGPSTHGGMGMGPGASSPPPTNAPLHRVDSMSAAASAYGRPPQHPAAASRPPPVSSNRPPGPIRPQSASSSHSSPPTNYNAPLTHGGVHQLADQMQGMNVGGRPAPEHVFAGAGLGLQRPGQSPGIPGPASPFEGVNRPQQGLFNATQSPGVPPRHGQSGYDVPQTPSTPGSIPGSPFYPAPLQHGHGPSHQGTMGPSRPTHQHTMGPTHQNTLGPQYQPASPAPQPATPPHTSPGPHHQHTLGPQHQHSLGPQHQSSVGPGHPYPSPGPPPQPGRPGQPPQPVFQPSGAYIPHHQSTGYHSPPSAPSPQPGYLGPPARQDSYPGHPGYQAPQNGLGNGGHPPTPQHGGPQSGGYPSNPQQPTGGWQAHSQQGGSGYPPQQPGGYSPQTGSAGPSPQPLSGPPLHPGSYPPQAGGQPSQPGYSSYNPQGQPGQPGHRPAIPGVQYVDNALGMVGKYAGEDTKKKLESGVNSALNGAFLILAVVARVAD
ncbi:xylosidase/arabinosidase [Ceratobasidium sp. AG-Ba]|nr:xylosidase/arabinosidase [Ceratobasidium sp. AG-Ba]